MVPDRLGGATVPTGRAWCSPGGDVMPSRCQRSRVSGVTGEKGSAPWRHQLSEQHEERPIAGGKYRPLDHSRRDDDLLTQQRVLRDELLSGASQVGEQPDDYGCGDGWRPARRFSIRSTTRLITARTRSTNPESTTAVVCDRPVTFKSPRAAPDEHDERLRASPDRTSLASSSNSAAAAAPTLARAQINADLEQLFGPGWTRGRAR